MGSVSAKADVLIIDDAPATLRLLSSILEKEGYNVRVALDGVAGLAAARLVMPDLILLDVKLPGLDGYAVCEALKQEKRFQHLPVIFISALEDPVDKVHAFRIGGVDYVTKPFHVEEVMARVESQLALSRQREWEQQHAIIEERQRVARELHDAVNQTLFSLGIKAEALRLRYQGKDTEIQEELATIHHLAQAALAEMRILLFELRPEMIVRTDFRRKVRELSLLLGAHTGAEVHLQLPDYPDDYPLPPPVHLMFYRILQEAITNIIRHAQASHVQIALLDYPTHLSLHVSDDGIGFTPDALPDHGSFGLVNMRERAAACGSDLTIHSHPGSGTTLELHWYKGEVQDE